MGGVFHVTIQIIGIKQQDYVIHARELTNIVKKYQNVFVGNNYLMTMVINVLLVLNQSFGMNKQKYAKNVH